ncbi:hypothetical protein [Mesobacterium pallidum]|uniref:hypothetical protein n=1 Tax=Mesobacterium pallidum TaxID=2872037 RepID=UPI001EE35CB1|nr:hypothetical protein [Mesobacterium pallidum]
MTSEEFHKRVRAICDELIEAGHHYREQLAVLANEIDQALAEDPEALDPDFVDITFKHEAARVTRALERD